MVLFDSCMLYLFTRSYYSSFLVNTTQFCGYGATHVWNWRAFIIRLITRLSLLLADRRAWEEAKWNLAGFDPIASLFSPPPFFPSLSSTSPPPFFPFPNLPSSFFPSPIPPSYSFFLYFSIFPFVLSFLFCFLFLLLSLSPAFLSPSPPFFYFPGFHAFLFFLFPSVFFLLFFPSFFPSILDSSVSPFHFFFIFYCRTHDYESCLICHISLNISPLQINAYLI